MGMNWSAPTDFALVCKRAAGRRRYNAKRRAEARERYKIVVEAIMPTNGRKRGSQAQLARALGVSRSTICRDVAKWRRLLLDVMRRYRSLMAVSESIADTDEVK
jgi:predicted DNA-binding transcriptional regulator YafY